MRRLKFLVLFFWTLALLGLEAWRYPVPPRGALGLLASAAWAASLLLAALLLGRVLLRRFRLYHASLVEEAGFSFALGLVGLSLFGSLLGALGVLYPWVCRGAVLAVCLVCWGHAEALWHSFRLSLRSKHPWTGSSAEVATVLCLALAGFAVAALCLAPPKFFDAMVYHLARAQRAAASGALAPQDGMLFSWLPSLPTPLWAWALALDGAPAAGAQAAGLLDLGIFAALGLMLMDASARLFNDRRIWLAPALALTQSLLALSFGVLSPDAWAAFFAFVSLHAFLLGLGERVRRSQASWFLLSALLAGAAAASKPVALVHAAALLVLAGVLAWKDPFWRRPGLLLGGLALFLLPLAPWLLQGAWFKGQPFYPFPLHLLGRTLAQGGPAPYFRHVEGFGGSGPGSWLRLPWAVFFDAGSLGGDGTLGVLLLALVPACFVWRLDRPLRWALAYLVLACLAWLLGPHVLRYAECLIPAAAFLAAYGVLEAEQWAFSRTWVQLWQAVIVAGLLLTAGQTLAVAVKDFDPLPVDLGLEAPEAYLARMGVPQALAADWIRQRRPLGAHVLVLGDERSAYLPPDSLASTVYEDHPLAAWTGQAADPQQMDALVRAKGYDFVYFNAGEWRRLGGPSSGPLYWPRGDARAEARFFAWLDHLRALPPQDRLSAGDVLVARLR